VRERSTKTETEMPRRGAHAPVSPLRIFIRKETTAAGVGSRAVTQDALQVDQALERWRARGRMLSTPDGEVWMLDEPGSDPSAVPVFLLHGFPSSAHDFAEAIERLGGRRRVVALDFLGFGLSDKPADHGYSLFEQADLALLVARAAGLQRAHIWAHDMGTSVTTELLARRQRGLLPLDLTSVTLMNGSVHIELAHLTPGQKLLRSPLGDAFARLSNRRIFELQVRRTFGRPPSAETVETMWRLLSRAGGSARMARTIAYIEERHRFHGRWIGALERCDVPALVAWGRRDVVAVYAIAEQLAREIPGARFETWDDLGHWPQMEDPARVAATVRAFWEAVERR
jgi:pimeloyl-ACP methyl ester carboxylesterase